MGRQGHGHRRSKIRLEASFRHIRQGNRKPGLAICEHGIFRVNRQDNLSGGGVLRLIVYRDRILSHFLNHAGNLDRSLAYRSVLLLPSRRVTGRFLRALCIFRSCL